MSGLQPLKHLISPHFSHSALFHCAGVKGFRHPGVWQPHTLLPQGKETRINLSRLARYAQKCDVKAQDVFTLRVSKKKRKKLCSFEAGCREHAKRLHFPWRQQDTQTLLARAALFWKVEKHKTGYLCGFSEKQRNGEFIQWKKSKVDNKSINKDNIFGKI